LRVINLILAESSLELVPNEIANHPSVIKNARRRGKTPRDVILDISVHFSAMRNLPNRHKRGRPDIVHVSLLEALSSPLNLEGLLRIYVHTINDYVIFIHPLTRIPRNYNRFVGLMEQLLKEGQVPPGSPNPLMYLRNLNFVNLINYLNTQRVILLDEGGELRGVEDICSIAIKEGLPLVVGGFPHGTFSKYVYELSKYVFSIYPKPLDTWVVVSRVIAGCEKVLNIMP